MAKATALTTPSARYWHENRDRLLEASIARSRDWRRDPTNADGIRAVKAAYRAVHREQRRRYGRDRGPELIGMIRADPCAHCGSRADLTVDHIDPLTVGGKHVAENLTAACRPCNSAKKERPLLRFLLERVDESPAAASVPRLSA